MNKIVVVGSTGALGNMFIKQLYAKYPSAEVHSLSAKSANVNSSIHQHTINYTDEATIEEVANQISNSRDIDMVIVATGILHTGDINPEKSIKELSFEKFESIFRANTAFPAMVAKNFMPKLTRDNKSTFACISARVGSIEDNQLGGWYAYRMSKAALNMFIKTASIEMKRTHPRSVIVGLHPGTVDSKLSKPFQGHVPEGKLFTPEISVQHMLNVLDNLDSESSGKCFAWDGSVIPF